MEVSGHCHAPAALHPERTGYPLCRRLGGPQGRCKRVRKISLPPGFEPQTVQPVASRYPGPQCKVTIGTIHNYSNNYNNKRLCVCVGHTQLFRELGI